MTPRGGRRFVPFDASRGCYLCATAGYPCMEHKEDYADG